MLPNQDLRAQSWQVMTTTFIRSVYVLPLFMKQYWVIPKEIQQSECDLLISAEPSEGWWGGRATSPPRKSLGAT